MEYKIIEDFPKYEINEEGNIRNKKTGRIMKPYMMKSYYRITLIKEKGKRDSAPVHRLLALAFIPNPENKPIIDHINRIKTDNRLSNLRWATFKENAENVERHKKGHKKVYDYGLIFQDNMWIVKIKKNNRLQIYGTFPKIEDAIICLNKNKQTK